ncbi:YadA-like family protein [Sneathia sanguinegens]|uniref:YadA-like family protein n=1 Tax=Sneathia sanguinegens TaxID=40543 RepID=UPI0029064614|nr:YadA-like family protein [Sneathia sanguinegens]MDU7496661.1 YadA-like family protein [Sneathia sanguinegens]
MNKKILIISLISTIISYASESQQNIPRIENGYIYITETEYNKLNENSKKLYEKVGSEYRYKIDINYLNKENNFKGVGSGITYGEGTVNQSITSVAIGKNVKVRDNSSYSIGIGASVLVENGQNVAIGTEVYTNQYGVSIGYDNYAGNNAVSIGGAKVTENDSIGIGNNTFNSGMYSIALGSESINTTIGSVVIGPGAISYSKKSLEIDGNNIIDSTKKEELYKKYFDEIKKENEIVLKSKIREEYKKANKIFTEKDVNDSLIEEVRKMASFKLYKEYSGYKINEEGERWIKRDQEADGFNTTIGFNSKTLGKYSTSLGAFSEAYNNSVSIGLASVATGENSVALGNFSEANERNTVSLGNDKIKRRITNLSEGINDFDAVNIKQLKSVSLKSDVALGGVANAIAMSSMAQPREGLLNIIGAYGTYGGRHALAVGISGNTERFSYKLGVSTNMRGNVGVGLGFGMTVVSSTKDDTIKRMEKKILEYTKESKEQNEKIKELENEMKELRKLINK